MDDRLALSVTHQDGSVTRWGPDEVDAANIAGGLRFGTSIPGGNKTLTCSLLRRIDWTYNDQGLFDDIRAYGPGNRTAWNGRMVQFPRSHGENFAITPGAVGYAAHLRDDPSFSMIYVDRDQSQWGPMSRARRLTMTGRALYDPSQAPDVTNGLPAVITGLKGPWVTFGQSEAWYDAGPGLKVAAVYYDFVKNGNLGLPDVNWSWIVYSAADDDSTFPSDSGNLAAASGSGYFTATPPERWAMLYQAYNGSAGTDGLDYEVTWRNLAVYGDHGLTRRGTDPGGFYASDVIADILTRAAPLLTYTTGPGGSIEATTFPIEHLVFRDPTTAEDAILQTNKFHQYEWGVYDNRVFFYRQPDPDRLTWQARLDKGAQLDVDGLAADDVFNGAFVRYQDPAGKTHTAGPPGSSAEATDASLADTSELNPVNAHGIPRRWALIEVSQTTTQAGAIQIGAAWLAQRALSARKGTMRLTGQVTHPTRGDRPVWEIRAGDFVEIADHPDTAPRRIIETDYSHDNRTTSLSLDNTVDKLDALFERAGVGLIGVL